MEIKKQVEIIQNLYAELKAARGDQEKRKALKLEVRQAEIKMHELVYQPA